MAYFDRQEWYDEPHYYDIVYDVDSDLEADFLEAAHLRYQMSSGRDVLEPACGSGRLVRRLASRGFRVSGFDLNPSMLAYARKSLEAHGVEAELEQKELTSFTTGRKRFDLAHCLVSSFRHVAEAAGAEEHLARVATALKPGGIYVLGLLLTDYNDRARTFERFAVERGATRVLCHHTTFPADRRARTATMRARMTVIQDGETRRFESSWTSRTYGPRQLLALVEREPRFQVVGCHNFDYDIESPSSIQDDRLDKILVLRKTR